MAGTPCPYHGIIGADARIAWQNDELNRPKTEEEEDDKSNAILGGIGASILGFLLIL